VLCSFIATIKILLMKIPLFSYLSCVIVLLLAVSCVEDVDFNQAEDIVITPVVDLNLIRFNVNANSFFDPETPTTPVMITDTLGIDFLKDIEAQENITRIDLLFRFINSVSRSFEVDLDFLNASGNSVYEIHLNVLEGSLDNPVTTPDIIETITQDNLLEFSKSKRVAVSISVSSSNSDLEGVLTLQSSATYFLKLQ